MVVGLFSSAAAPALVLDHEEAQAADWALELPKFLQPKAQIRAKGGEACGSLSQRGGGHYPDPKRASRTGKIDALSAWSEHKQWRCSLFGFIQVLVEYGRVFWHICIPFWNLHLFLKFVAHTWSSSFCQSEDENVSQIMSKEKRQGYWSLTLEPCPFACFVLRCYWTNPLACLYN